MLLEGGDIILYNGFIFAGFSGRRNEAGINYLLQESEPDFDVVLLQPAAL